MNHHSGTPRGSGARKQPEVTQAHWCKSSFSGGGGNTGGDCVEWAVLPDGRAAVRDSKAPEAGTVSCTRDGMRAWLQALKGGRFDGHS